jgi:hypothetical protein
MPKNRKFPKRKRLFNLQTTEGRDLSQRNQKLFDAFPDVQKRLHYIKALIKEFDRMIALCPEN